ncbi:MFS transporter [Parasulfitobacter algicola]|uniref:MFS transporter n=1 Tax=Parasulfitobacter algicola TaxID=2614809 RepID=A0ABX2IT31_9RHOB|nr:MFS transporter [Sulfitobacter algicola]NSX55166.1 MFS transporter [Sulfitobacter algicola]
MPSYQVILLTASVGVIGANSLVLSPVSAAVAQSFAGNSAADIMIAAAAFGLGTAGSALLLAPLADRFGADRSLIAAMILFALASMFSTIAPAFWVLIAAQTMAGVASGIALPATYSLAADIASPGQEGRTMGTVLTGWTLSMVFGVTLSSILADLLHWRSVFAFVAGLAALLSILLLTVSFPRRIANHVTSPLTSLKVPGIFTALMVQILLMLSFYGTYSFLGTHLGAMGMTTAAGAAPVLAYGIGFGIAARFDGLIDRMGYKGLAPYSFACVTAALVLIAVLSYSLIGLTIAFLCWGLANHIALNLTVGRLIGLDPDQRGAIMGLNSAVTYLCVFAGAIGFRPIFEIGGLAACAGLAAIAVSFIVIEAWHLKRSRPAN